MDCLRPLLSALVICALAVAPAFAQSTPAQPIGPSTLSGSNGGGGAPITTPLTAGDLIAATGTTTAGDSSTLTGPAILPVNLNLTGNLTLSGAQAATQAQQWSNITVGGTSTDTTGYQGYWQFRAVDSAAAAGNAPLNGFTMRLQLTGTQGLRNAIDGYVSIDVMPSSSDTSLQNYVGVIGQGYSDVSAKTGLVGGANYSGYAGSLWGLVGTPFLGTSDASKNAVHWLGMYGVELDLGNVFSGSDVAERYGAFIVGKGSILGTISDAGIDFTGAMGNGIQFGGVRQAFSATALIATVAQTQGGTSNPTVTNGIDLTVGTYSTCVYKATNFCDDGSGNLSANTVNVTGILAPANGLSLTSANNIGAFSNSTLRQTWTSGGVIMFGPSASTRAVSNAAVTPIMEFTNNGSTPGQNGLGLLSYRAVTSNPATLFLEQSNSSTLGTQTAVITAQQLGLISSGGSDGTAFQDAAQIRFEAQGTISAGVVPGLIRFRTATTGGVMTDAMIITNAQTVQLPAIATGTPAASLCIDASNNIIKKTTTGSCI